MKYTHTHTHTDDFTPLKMVSGEIESTWETKNYLKENLGIF